MNRSSHSQLAAGNDGTEIPLVSMQESTIAAPPRTLGSSNHRKVPGDESLFAWRSRFISRKKSTYDPIDLENMESTAPNYHDAEESAPPYLSISLGEPRESKIPLNDEDHTYQRAAPVEPKSFQRKIRLLGLKFGRWIHAREVVKHILIFMVFVCLIIIPVLAVTSGTDSIRKVDIAPFVFECNGGTGWSWVGINLVVATDFSFGTAKAVDLAWNWIIGRGLQGVLSVLAYRVFCDAIMRAAELTPMSYELYACVTVSSNKIEMMWQLSKGLGKFGNWRVKAIFIWLFLSTIYLVAFPGLLDACSGYDAAQVSSFKWPGGELQNVEEIVNDIYFYGTLRPTYYSEPYRYLPKITNSSIVSTHIVCASYYKDRDDVWRDFSYTPLTKNTTSLYLQGCQSAKTYNNELDQPDKSGPEQMYTYDWSNEIVNASWWARWQADPKTSQIEHWAQWEFWPSNKSNFVCDTQNNVYQWGFTYEWFVVVVGANSIWLFGMYVLWMECQFNSELCKKKRHLGIWRAIADLSEAMREDLGTDVCAYSNKEIATVLKKRPPIKYYVEDDYKSEAAHIGLSSRPSGQVLLRWDRIYAGKKGKEH